MSEVPTWPKISGALGSTTTEFGASDWANLISDYFNGTNLALVDASKLPVIGSLTKFKFEKLGLYDVDGSHYLSFSVDDIDTGANRKIKFRRMNTPFEEDYAVLEGLAQAIINKTIDSDLNTITNIVNADIKAAAGIVYSKLSLTNSIVDSDVTAHTTTKITTTSKSLLNTAIVYNDQTNSFGDFDQVFKDNRLRINNPADTFSYTLIGAAIAANRNLTLPLLTGNDTLVTEAFTQTLTNKTLTTPTISTIVNTGTITLPTSTDTLVGRATTDTLTNKTINPTSNTISFLNSFTYTIYQSGGTVYARNNKTGAVTNNANLDPLVTTILASGDPSFEVQSGTYTLSSGLTKITVPSYAEIKMQRGTKIIVPQGYADCIFFLTANAQYITIEGGEYSEAGTPSSNWYVVEMFPDMSPSEEGVLHNRIASINAYQAKAPIHLKTDTTSWINSNTFEDIFANRCKYLIFKEHVNAFTALASGMNVNTFINCRMQAQPSTPQALGGVVGIDGDANNFINCSVWDLQAANASAKSLDISSNARYTTIFGGYIASYNITDSGKWTAFHDKYQGLSSHKLGITAVEATGGGSNEIMATFKVRDDTSNFFQIENGTVTDALLLPQFRFKQYTANNFARIDIHDVATAFDTGTTPFYLIDFRKNNASAITSTTKPLFRIGNFATGEYDFYIDRLDMKNNSIVNLTLDADGTGNSITNIENADIKAAAGIVTSKLADSANFILKTLDNAFGAHYQDFTKMTAPGNPGANDIRLYVDTADTHLKIKNNAGTVVDLHTGGGGGATNLDALTDVDLTTTPPSNGDVLTYTTTGTKWVPAAAPGAGGGITASSVDTLTNKTIDADGTGNSITNIENADIKAAANIAVTKLAIGSAQQVLATNAAGTANAFTNPIPVSYDYLISKISTTYYATKSGEVIPKYSNTALHTLCASVVSDLSTTGGVIAFAANSTFITSGTAITLANNITWKGMDRITSIIKNSSAHEIFRWNDGGGAQLTNAGITDLHMIIHDPSTTASAVYIDGSSNFKFNRNWVESKSTPSSPIIATFFDTESLAHFHDNMEVKDNWWTGNNNGQDAFGNGNLRNCIVTGNFFKDHTDGQAIGAASPIFTIFSNNTFHNTGNAFGFETVTENCTISNNICYNTTGIKMAGNASSNISRRNLVSDNIIIYGDGGIEAGNCYYDTFVNNKIVRTGIYGIRGALHNCTVRGNEFIDTNHSNSSTTVNSVSSTRGGIMIINNTANQPDSDNNLIVDNKFVDTGATFTDPVSATSKSGNTGPIVLDTNCSGTILINNQFTGLVGGTVIDYGIGTYRKDAGERSLLEDMKGRYIEGELFIISGDYGSGQFATSYATAIGTGNRTHDSTDGLARFYEAAAGAAGNKGGRAVGNDLWMRKWQPRIFITFKLYGTTTQHALFLGLASVNDGTSVHATAQLPSMTGIGISVTTDNSNFRIASNSGSASCTYTDTTIAKDTNRHTIEIWTDDTNWYWKFDAGPTGTISSAIPAQTTKMYAVWHNLTNDTNLKDFYLYKYASRVIIPP